MNHGSQRVSYPSIKIFVIVIQLDWVGPVDNRPSTDKLHNFFLKKKRKKKKKKKITCDT